MLRITAFVILVFLFVACTGPSGHPIEVRKTSSSNDEKERQHIMVSIDKDQQFYIGTQKADSSKVDSLLLLEIQKFRATVDTPTVVINADMAAWYGSVYRVMRFAKMHGARVVATVR